MIRILNSRASVSKLCMHFAKD